VVAKVFLVSNERTKVGHNLSRIATSADKIHIAVAYLAAAKPVENWLKGGARVKLVVALQPPTNAGVLRTLVNSFPVHLEARFYSLRFHSKMFILFRGRVPICAQVGSSNLTNGGMYSNLETNVILHNPKQLKELAEHFRSVWDASVDLEPKDIDAYEQYCNRTKEDLSRIRRKQEEFEHRVVRPRIKSAVGGHEYKEARDYLAFWKAVDDVVRVVKSVSMKEWPSVPLYLAVDHFWHWLVKVRNKDPRERIGADPKLRAKRLPELFTAYAHWDKSSSKYTSGMKKNSDYLRGILAMNRLPKLNSGHMRTKRFGADRTFANANTLTRIKRAFAYLLWSEADITERISELLPGGRYRLIGFGASNIQELIGWVHPTEMPLRNNKADNALEMLGYRFR